MQLMYNKQTHLIRKAEIRRKLMVSIYSGSTALFNIGINIFSCIIVTIILFSYKKNFASTHDIRLLIKTTFGIVIVLLLDIMMWLLNGKSGRLAGALSHAVITSYFFVQIYIVFEWVRYAWYRIFGKKMDVCKEKLFVIIPLTVFALFTATNFLTEWIFYIDQNNMYHRGILSEPLAVALLMYPVIISVLALYKRKGEQSHDRRTELLTIALFILPPFLGASVQIALYGISLLWPATAISSLLILLNKESQAILQDPLTGLNNRRNMEKHFAVYEQGQNRMVTVIMLDLDNFKHINDQYGHSVGDKALHLAADILRSVFIGTSAFLARLGGDEFIVIIPQGKESAARETEQKIKDAFDAFSRTEKLPFSLSASIGWAISDSHSPGRMERLLKEADEKMYRDKTAG